MTIAMQLPASAAAAIQALEAAHFETWTVGGCVRDSLLGCVPHDWDICTAALPEQVRAVFPAERLLETGLQHGTVTLLTTDGPLEITTFRQDGDYSDGRHPNQVRFVRNIKDDLARRDFTVGAMAWHPARGLYDPFGGAEDLQQGILRAVGHPDTRFQEDGLRILRAVRFASKLGFTVETETAAAMRRQLSRLDCVSPERIREELNGILCGRFVCRALHEFSDILGYVLPELQPMFGCAHQNAHHQYDVWEHSVRAVGQVPALPVLRLSMLLHDSGKPACKTIDANGTGHFYGHPKASRALAEQIVRRLRYANRDADQILFLVGQHDRPLGQTPKQLRRCLSRIGEEAFRQLLILKKGDAVGQGTHPEHLAELCETEQLLNDVLREAHCLSLRELAVNGNDMKALGLAGPAIGNMLRLLLDSVLEETVPNEKQALLSFARTQISYIK